MLDELKTKKKLVGLKQSMHAIEKHETAFVYVACNSSPDIYKKVTDCCDKYSVPYKKVDTMAELGSACGIEVGAAVVAVIK